MSVRETFIGICCFAVVLIELSSCGPIYTRYVRKRLSASDKETYVVEVKEVFHTVNHPPLFGSSEDDIERFLKYDLKYRRNNLGTNITHHNSQVPIAPTISIIEHDTFDNNDNNYDYQNGYDGFGNRHNGFGNRNDHTSRPTSAPATKTTTSRSSLFGGFWGSGSSKASGTTIPTTTARITTVPTTMTTSTTVPATTARTPTTTTTTTEETTTVWSGDYYDNEGELTTTNDPDSDPDDLNENNDQSTETEDENYHDDYDQEDETDGPTQEPTTTTTTTTTTEDVIETTTKRKSFVADFFPMKATTPTSAPATTRKWSLFG